MLTFLLTAQVIIATAPPLPPAEAVKVLQASRSLQDRTNAWTITEEDWFPSASIRSTSPKPGDGPFGPLKLSPPMPQLIHGITFRLPRDYSRRPGFQKRTP